VAIPGFEGAAQAKKACQILGNMQRESLYFAVLLLFGLLLQPALSIVNGNDRDMFMVIDYDSSASGSSASGSGIMPLTPDPSCTLAEESAPPLTVNGTEEELRRKAMCHALCVSIAHNVRSSITELVR